MIVSSSIASMLRTLQSFSCVWEDVEFHGELEVCVDFDFPHGIEIELESLQMYHEMIGEMVEAHTLSGIHLAVACAAHVLVVAIKHITSHEQIQRLLQCALVLH